MEELKITHEFIVNQVKNFLINKKDGNWHEEKAKVASLHEHGADLIMTGGKRNSEKFIIECKGKSYANSCNSINKEGWLNALGQLVTRMDAKLIIENGKMKGAPNRAYKYGLGLCLEAARVALRRIPHEAAKVMNLYLFACDDNGSIQMFTPSKFLKKKKE